MIPVPRYEPESERGYRRRCVETGVISGVVLGFGCGVAIWGNPYIALSLILGGLLLLVVADTAASSAPVHREEGEG